MGEVVPLSWCWNRLVAGVVLILMVRRTTLAGRMMLVGLRCMRLLLCFVRLLDSRYSTRQRRSASVIEGVLKWMAYLMDFSSEVEAVVELDHALRSLKPACEMGSPRFVVIEAY